MTTFLTDASVLIDVLNNKGGRRDLLLRLLAEGHRLACCTVVLAELFSGVRPAEIEKIDRFVSMLIWYPATPAIARRAGRWRFEWGRQGIALSFADTLIAATAVEHQLVLITGNRGHFPMPELSVHLCENV